MPPASLHTHRERQLARLDGAIDNVWNRDDGVYRHELNALRALVLERQMPPAEAIARIVALERTAA